MKEVVLNTVAVERIDNNGKLVLENIANTAEWIECDLTETQDTLPTIFRSEIMQVSTKIAGKNFEIGDLKLSLQSDKVFATINARGELIIVGEDANNYVIENNELVYRRCNE